MKQRAIVAAALALAACAPTSENDGGSTDTSFSFQSFAEPTFTVVVRDENGQPLRGVSVSVEDVYMEDLDDDSDRGHSVYLRGLTDTTGVFQGDARLPEVVTTVDVVLHAEGRSGPWTNTTLRDSLGFFAPSSRLTRTVNANNIGVEATLEAN